MLSAEPSSASAQPTGELTHILFKLCLRMQHPYTMHFSILYFLFVCLFLLIIVVEKNLKISPKQKHIKFHWVYSNPVI